MTTDQIREALGNAREHRFPQEATDVKEITMEPIQCDWLSFEPVEIITYCDGLQVFTSFVKDRQFLILWCDSTKKISRYLVAEWNSEMRKKLRTKEVDLRRHFPQVGYLDFRPRRTIKAGAMLEDQRHKFRFRILARSGLLRIIDRR